MRQEMVAQRLRKAVENTKIDISKINADANEKIISVTISLGISEYTNGDNEKKVLQKADKALYKAKENGRNRAEVYEEISADMP